MLSTFIVMHYYTSIAETTINCKMFGLLGILALTEAFNKKKSLENLSLFGGLEWTTGMEHWTGMQA